MKLFMTTVAALSVTAATAATANVQPAAVDMIKLVAPAAKAAVSSDPLVLAQRRYRQQCQEDFGYGRTGTYGCGGYLTRQSCLHIRLTFSSVTLRGVFHAARRSILLSWRSPFTQLPRWRHATVICRNYHPASACPPRECRPASIPDLNCCVREFKCGRGSSMRFAALAASFAGTLVFGLLIPFSNLFIPLFALCAGAGAIGIWDLLQPRHSIRRNYPIMAHIRFGLEKIRPEIRQYFLESDTDGTPFNRSKRAVAYQRAKGRSTSGRSARSRTSTATISSGSIIRSLRITPRTATFASRSAGRDCRKPYALSLFNVSAMSFGALSANAIRALNKGAKLGGFAHDTGEGGISRYHREFGGDLIWEIGSGYFGCRNDDGSFLSPSDSPRRRESRRSR